MHGRPKGNLTPKTVSRVLNQTLTSQNIPTILTCFTCYRRLDYFVVSKRFMVNVCDSIIRPDVYGSDHCPVVLLAAV